MTWHFEGHLVLTRSISVYPKTMGNGSLQYKTRIPKISLQLVLTLYHIFSGFFVDPLLSRLQHNTAQGRSYESDLSSLN